jgi:hypothetical protein
MKKLSIFRKRRDLKEVKSKKKESLQEDLVISPPSPWNSMTYVHGYTNQMMKIYLS